MSDHFEGESSRYLKQQSLRQRGRQQTRRRKRHHKRVRNCRSRRHTHVKKQRIDERTWSLNEQTWHLNQLYEHDWNVDIDESLNDDWDDNDGERDQDDYYYAATEQCPICKEFITRERGLNTLHMIQCIRDEPAKALKYIRQLRIYWKIC